MRFKWYYKRKQVTKKWVVENFGSDCVASMMQEAERVYYQDRRNHTYFHNGIGMKFWEPRG